MYLYNVVLQYSLVKDTVSRAEERNGRGGGGDASAPIPSIVQYLAERPTLNKSMPEFASGS